MKNTIFFFIAALLVTASVSAQSTVDSIRAKYQLQPMPEALTIEKTFPVLGTYQLSTPASQSAMVDTMAVQNNITITLDTANRGIIWISGLPEGTMKAFLKKSPGTYRILSQKTDNGKFIPEGTLFFDPATNTLNIALGKPFDDADPTSVFASMNANANSAVSDDATEVKTKTKTAAGKTKTKTKMVYYTATKAETTTSASDNAAKQ